MSILVDRATRLIVQGITGAQGRFHTEQMLSYGTRVVAGVTPGKGGAKVAGVPVYDTVAEAVTATDANTSVIYVPPASAADAILEAADAQLALVVCITEGIPILDMARVKKYLEGKKTRLLGPNCPGAITPNECKVGILPGPIHQPGHVGVVSRSGTLTYEAVAQLSHEGLGQSTAVGIGGDPVKGMGFVDILQLFNDDPATFAVVMIGEIGGGDEQEAAVWIQRKMTKPVVAFVAGRTAPPGKRMGHAGAIIAGGGETAAAKIAVLRQSGVRIAATPDAIGRTMAKVLREAGI
jgi:succinyl-CoA synthetase alpha subunit